MRSPSSDRPAPFALPTQMDRRMREPNRLTRPHIPPKTSFPKSAGIIGLRPEPTRRSATHDRHAPKHTSSRMIVASQHRRNDSAQNKTLNPTSDPLGVEIVSNAANLNLQSALAPWSDAG